VKEAIAKRLSYCKISNELGPSLKD